VPHPFAFFAKGWETTNPNDPVHQEIFMALTESTMLELGAAAPDFALTNVVTGKTVHRDDFRGQEALLVMFICTHCPYVKHIEKGLAALGKDYTGKPFGIVAISSNDVTTHPEDGPAGLKQQAKTFGFNFPYLYDETQTVAHAYKAACTPDFFLFDAGFHLVYRGQFDLSRPSNGIAVTGENLRSAIDAALAGKSVSLGQRPSIGCNIKWKT
jgi:peroxiredoxin